MTYPAVEIEGDAVMDVRLLHRVARMLGIAVSYRNFRDELVRIEPDILVRMINGLYPKAQLTADLDAKALAAVLDTLRQRRCEQVLPATVIAWDGICPDIWVWLEDGVDAVSLILWPENKGIGSEQNQTAQARDITRRMQTPDGRQWRRVRLGWDKPVPDGYYTLQICAEDRSLGKAFLIAAPRNAGAMPDEAQDRGPVWGGFAPTYALRAAGAGVGSGGGGIGGYRELRQAAQMIKRHGGSFIGTLPLLATFYEGDAANESPYSPASRLFWNEIFLDLDDLPGPYRHDGGDDEDDGGELVDYRACYARRKKVLQQAAAAYFEEHPHGDDIFQEYLHSTPYLAAYAKFRAGMDEGFESGEAAERFHLYVQYACHLQLTAMKKDAEDGQCAALYLDYPIGIHSDGFDARIFSHLFLPDFEVGAPPDMFFSKGQSWGFRPFNPRAFEREHFAYFRATIHHYFRYAGMLRLDHIMGLYRIYCIPHGESAARGTYVYYPFEAFMAVLCLEAQRHGGTLIGEDLGTVPDAVREGMDAHGLYRMWIAQFDIDREPGRSFDAMTEGMIAGFNTHDMFPFAAFLSGADLDMLQALDLLDAAEADRLRRARAKMLGKWKKMDDPYGAMLAGMADSPARYLMINMEDLWGEVQPQNVPGTTDAYPNWRRRFAVPTDEWGQFSKVFDSLNARRGRAT